MSIADDIRAYIIENFLLGVETGLDPTASLINTGVIDSTGILEVVLFLEQTYGFQIRDEEMLPENLDSIDNITRFVQRKTGGPDAAVEAA
jgi:acyl carrier protein